MNKYRSHNCNELRKDAVGKDVVLSGWVNKKKTKSSYRLQTGDLIEIYDISKLKPLNKREKVKYLPKKKRNRSL